MAFCPNCGNKLPDNAKFCASCGAKITMPAAPAAEQPAPEAPTQQEKPQQPAQNTQPVQNYRQPVQNTPPVQNYQQPVQQAPVQTAPNTAPAKPANKKLIPIIGGCVLAAVLIVVLICTLGGKSGDAATDPNAGVYTAVAAEMWGIEMPAEDLWEKGMTVELMDGGKCKLTVDGEKGSGKWTLDGTAVTISGDGIDAAGTLKDGVMTLENVMDMGVTLTLVREGGANTGANVPASSDSTPAPIVANLPDSLTSPYTALQKQWNGAWYGVMHVIESSGSFSAIPQGDYDAFLTVEIDENSEGTFEVYLNGYDTPLAAAECYATEDGLYARKGSFAGSEMNIYNWMFLPMPAYASQYAMGDTVTENGSMFDFTMFVKPWGADWDAEIADDALFPPSVDLYYDSVAKGELPPYGGAPYYYNFN